MYKHHTPLTANQLRQWYHYDPEVGFFFRKLKKGLVHLKGRTSGRGYIYVTIPHTFHKTPRTYAVHRLAWLYVHGSWPKGVIDHINGIKNDNRISNLRDVTCAGNSQNLAVGRLKNPFPGTCWKKNRNKWQASITTNGKTTYLGLFEKREDAHRAYMDAKAVMHPLWDGR